MAAARGAAAAGRRAAGCTTAGGKGRQVFQVYSSEERGWRCSRRGGAPRGIRGAGALWAYSTRASAAAAAKVAAPTAAAPAELPAGLGAGFSSFLAAGLAAAAAGAGFSSFLASGLAAAAAATAAGVGAAGAGAAGAGTGAAGAGVGGAICGQGGRRGGGGAARRQLVRAASRVGTRLRCLAVNMHDRTDFHIIERILLSLFYPPDNRASPATTPNPRLPRTLAFLSLMKASTTGAAAFCATAARSVRPALAASFTAATAAAAAACAALLTSSLEPPCLSTASDAAWETSEITFCTSGATGVPVVVTLRGFLGRLVMAWGQRARGEGEAGQEARRARAGAEPDHGPRPHPVLNPRPALPPPAPSRW
jgi:hypothetical protein